MRLLLWNISQRTSVPSWFPSSARDLQYSLPTSKRCIGSTRMLIRIMMTMRSCQLWLKISIHTRIPSIQNESLQLPLSSLWQQPLQMVSTPPTPWPTPPPMPWPTPPPTPWPTPPPMPWPLLLQPLGQLL